MDQPDVQPADLAFTMSIWIFRCALGAIETCYLFR